MPRNTFAVGLYLAFASAASLITSGEVNAQSASTSQVGQIEVSLSAEQARSFKKSLDAITERSRIGFVVEGRPLHATLSEQEAYNLTGKMPVEVAVDRVIKAYDYQATRQGDLYLLNKRYTDPADLPSVTLEECRLALQDMVRNISLVAPDIEPQRHPDWDPATSPLMASLTDRQLRRMSGSIVDGNIMSPLPTACALPVSSLTPSQQELARQVALNLFLQFRLDDGKSVLKEYEMLVKHSPIFCWKKTSGTNVFGYETALTDDSHRGATYFWPLNASPTLTIVEGGPVGDIRSIGFLSHQVTESAATSPDPVKPLSPSEFLAEEATGATTLGKVINSLNSRAVGVKMKVEEALADKSVTLSGEANLSPVNIFHALATVYALRVKTEKDGTLVLTNRRIKTVNDLTSLPAIMPTALPDPLCRAFHCDAGESVTDGKPMPKSIRRSQFAERSTFIAEAAAQRLRTLIEPRAKRMSEERISLSSLGSEERTTLAVLVMAQNWSRVNGLMIRSLPTSITQFDKLHLVGGLYEERGKTKFALFLALPRADGKIQITGDGVSNVGYSKRPE